VDLNACRLSKASRTDSAVGQSGSRRRLAMIFHDSYFTSSRIAPLLQRDDTHDIIGNDEFGAR
jgi:hypothetical protein